MTNSGNWEFFPRFPQKMPKNRGLVLSICGALAERIPLESACCFAPDSKWELSAMIAYNGYSSKVALTLLIDGMKLALSHVGSSRFVVRDPCNPQPASDAEIVIEINDSAERYKVFLPHGLPGPGQLVEYI